MVLILKLTYLYLTMEEQEVRTICKSIVDKAKATAAVDQGRLKRSIAYTYIRGVVKFRQVYWGYFGDNSYLDKLAAQFMPRGIPYSIELTVLGGGVYKGNDKGLLTSGKTRYGRSLPKTALKRAQNTTSKSINALAKRVAKEREKARNDGETEN